MTEGSLSKPRVFHEVDLGAGLELESVALICYCPCHLAGRSERSNNFIFLLAVSFSFNNSNRMIL